MKGMVVLVEFSGEYWANIAFLPGMVFLYGNHFRTKWFCFAAAVANEIAHRR
jgi:hypothetical protein